MTRTTYFLILAVSGAYNSYTQSIPPAKITSIDATIGAGSYQGSLSLSCFHTRRLSTSKKFGIGLGVRLTSFLGANVYYVTAPAKLTSDGTSPLVIFKKNNVDNMDSLLIKSPQINALNLAINLEYQVSTRLIAGFNIDVVGFSFGKKTKGNYINGFEGKNTEANPTPFNILLISDNDKGSLNSEFYLKYSINHRWGFKLAGQFLFTEYTTTTPVQTVPEENDRFRNKSLMLSIGGSYKL
jgi:hypothetical protein